MTKSKPRSLPLFCWLLAIAVFCAATPAAAESAEPTESAAPTESERGYDRLAVEIMGTFGLFFVTRIPTSEPGYGNAAFPTSIGVSWRLTGEFALGAFANMGLLWMLRYGIVASMAPLGWDRHGPIVGLRLSRGFLGMHCPSDPDACGHHGGPVFAPSANGPFLALELAYRWSLGDGGWGFQIGVTADAAWLTSDRTVQSGLYLGGSGLRVTFDL